MYPPGGGAYGRGDVFQERDYVVVGATFDLRDLRNGKACALTDGAGIFGGDLAEGGELLAGEDLYLEPDFELALLGPELAHFGKRISINHRPERIRELSGL